MRRKLLIACLLLVSGMTWATGFGPERFKQLAAIYQKAAQALDQMQSAGDWERTRSALDQLEAQCSADARFKALLALSYPTCPDDLKDDYENTLKTQAEMKDAVKRLAMGGTLQKAEIARRVDQFVKAVSLRELVYDERVGLEGAPEETPEHRNARMKWWRDGKFGMFIHYGLYSGLAGEFQGKKYEGCVEWIQMQSGADFEAYKKEALPRFNPKHGMAEQWVELAKEAGCTYTVLTSRHHEGFNMFDTPQYGFNVKNMKGVDIISEYAEACRRHDMKAGYYFSLLDWNHPDYDPTGSGISYPEGNYREAREGKRQFGYHDRYKAYLRKIFNDLLDQYKVDLVWWDFSQPKFQGDHAWGATALMKDLFDKHPMAIQNNRLYHSDNHLSEGGIKVTPVWKGDYSTAEHHIPATGIDGDWEACQTLNGTWGYSADNQKWKTPEALIHELIDVVSRGGNFLLNIGPKPDGSIPEESVRLFKTIGRWMKTNGEAIYGTRANPFDKEFAWGRVTRKGDDRLYLLFYAAPEGGQIELPCTFSGKVKARFLHGGSRVKVQPSADGKCTLVDTRNVVMDQPAVVIELKGDYSL